MLAYQGPLEQVMDGRFELLEIWVGTAVEQHKRGKGCPAVETGWRWATVRLWGLGLSLRLCHWLVVSAPQFLEVSVELMLAPAGRLPVQCHGRKV